MMAGFRFPFLSVSPRTRRTLGPITAAIALLAILPQAWSSTTFTVANTTFPSSPVGTPTFGVVHLTVNTAVPITKISIAPSFTEYAIGSIDGAGCVVDPTGNTVVAAGTVCYVSVAYTPALPGSATAPPPISRSAPLLVNDIEGGKPKGYSFALTGSATGSVFAFAPGYLTAFVGNAGFVTGTTPGCPGQTDANGDGCPATDALIYPSSMALDPAGNLYISDGPLNVAHKIDATTGIISIFAGQYKTQGTGGSGGPATSIKLFNPAAVAVDQAGNVYIDDPVQGLWEINPATEIATIIAGGGQFSISTVIQDGKTADQAFIGNVNAMVVDPAGNIYIGVYSVSTVYRIDAVTDLISVVAGSVTNAFPATGIPGPAVDAKIGTIQSLAMDSTGNLYLADSVNGMVYKVDKSGNISNVAGKQTPAAQFGSICSNDSGDWGPAASAAISQPSAIAFDTADNLYIGEPGSEGGTSCPVRRMEKVTGLIHIVAGDITGSYAFLNNVGATETYLSPNLVAVDGGGNIYVGQQNISSGVSKILGSQSAIIFAQQSQDVTGLQVVSVGNVGIGDNLTLSNFPFPIVPIPGNATPTPFSNLPLAGTSPQDCSVGALAPGGVCGIQVAYNPTSPAKVAADETVEDDSLGVGGTSNVLNIQGSAYNGPTITLAPDPVNFPSQSVGVASAAKTVTFSIIISPNITYESTTITGPDASSFSLSSGGNTCTAGMAISGSGGTCNDYVIFNPQAGGALSATLNATFTAKGVTYTLSDPLSGTGNAPEPMAGFFPTSLAFGGQIVGTTSPAQAITLFNSGNAPLTGIAPTITGANPGSYALTSGPVTCTDTLPPASTCNFWFTFSPTAAGSLPATLSVADNAAGSPQTAPLTGTGVVFSSNVGTDEADQSVTVYITTAGTLNSINMMTQGAANLDFTKAAGGTCDPGTAYTAGESCTVDVVFNPTYAGARYGAILLTDAGGDVLATTYLPGTGAGPQIVFSPATQTGLVTAGSIFPEGVAVDGSGNVYLVDAQGNAVLKLPKTPSGYGPAVKVGSGYIEPFGVAVDGAGNVFVGDYAGGNVVEVPWTGSAYGPQVNLPLGALSRQPRGITVDSAGNVFFADYAHGVIAEIPLTPTGYGSLVIVPFTGLNSPNDVKVDLKGDVFCADTYGHNVVMLPWTGTGYGAQTVVATVTDEPLGIAFDANGDVYIANQIQTGGGNIVEVPATAGVYGTPVKLPYAVGTAYEVALDGAGNLFVAAPSTGQVFKIDVADPPSLTFAGTDVGSTSSDSPKTVIATNIGNVDLYFNALDNNPVYPLNFPVNNSDPNLCEEDNSVQPGSSCDVSVDFIPATGGSLSGAIVLTNNNLNTNATQSISVSGTGIAATAPAVTLQPPSLNFNVPTGNTSNVATSTLTNTGTAPLTITKTSLSGANPGSFIENDNCVAKSPIPINGTCTISVQFVSTVVGPFSAAVSIVDNAANSPQSLTLTATATPGAPIVTLTPALAFPVTPVGQGNQLSATLSNTGNAPLTNIGVTITGANSYMFNIPSGGSCFGKTTLPQDSACTISVDFLPPGPGSFAATLVVTDNAASSPQTSALTGSGSESELQFTPGQFNFLAGTPGKVGGTGSGPAINALISGGFGIALDSTGLVYFSDIDFNTVYQIDGSGNINVYAGIQVDSPGHGSYSGDNGPAASATLNGPEQIAFDPSGNLYIADRFNNVIRKVNSAGIITTFAGSYGNGFGGYGGDGGPANQATMNNPLGVTADSQGNVYIADTFNYVVRKVDTTGTITLFAGTPGVHGYSGDSGPATSATMGEIYHLATDLNGNLYIADYTNGVVRKVDSAGTITTYAGGGMAAVTPTPQPAASVNLNNGPVDLATDPAGNLYVLGVGPTNKPGVFLVNTSQQISQIVGGGASLVSGAPANAEDTNLDAIAVDAFGDLYVNDAFDHIVSEIDPNGDLAFPNTPVNTASAPLTVTLSNTGNAPLVFTNQGLEEVVRKHRHAAPPGATGAAHTARPDVVDFNDYGVISGPFAIASGGTCNFDDGIAAGASCTMNVTFNPTYTGAATGTITLFSNQGNHSDNLSSILLTGTGTQALVPGATLTPALPFPNTFVGATTSALAATLSNTGNGPLTIGTIAIGGANPSDFAIATGSNACGSTLAADATCNIYVTFTPASAAALSATLTVTDNASAATQSSSLTGTGIPLNPQVINFTQPTSPVTYAPGMTIPLVATGGESGNPVVFTIDASSTGAGTISGSTLTVTGSGSLVIDANQAGNASYSAAPQVQRTVVVNQAPQAINFTQPASPITYAPSLTVSLVATGGASGNAVVFTIDASSTGTGTITGSTLTVTGVGNLVIDANQAGNANYSAAAQVQRTVVVNKASQAILFTQPASPVTYSSGLTVPLVATGGASGNAVVFTIDESSTATGSISGSTLTVTGTGTFVIDANQVGNANYSAAPQVQRTLVVNAPIPQAIAFTQPASPDTYAPGLTVALAATGGASGNPVVLTIDASSTGVGSISGNTLTITAVGTFVIDANQAGNSTYTAAPQVQRTVVVNQAPQAINFTQPASPVIFSSGLTIALTAAGGASGNPVVFTLDESSTATGSISGNTLTVTSAGNLVIDANQSGNADYSAAPRVQRTVLVNPPPPDFTLTAAPSSQTVAPGGSTTFTVTVGATNGTFNNVVTLSASGLPTGANGAFAPASINPGDGKGTSTLTVQLAPALQASAHGSSWPLATPALALLFLLPFRRWRKVWRGKLLLLVAGLVSLASIVNLTGCGGGFLLGSVAQTYTITITGAGGNDTHSTTVQLTVK